MEETIQPEKKSAVGAMSPGREGQARFFLGMLTLTLVLWAMSAQAADSARVRGYVYETEPGVVVLESDNGILYTLKGKGLDAHIESTVDAVGDVSTDKSGNIFLSIRSLAPAQGNLEFTSEDLPARQ
ncbi:MAG: hypothetical protein AB1916_05500 [Thermodesulfobacteriota bacterium]